MFSLEVCNLISKAPWGINRADNCLSLLQDAILEGGAEIILTKARGLMDNTRSTLTGHIGVTVFCVYIVCVFVCICVQVSIICKCTLSENFSETKLSYMYVHHRPMSCPLHRDELFKFYCEICSSIIPWDWIAIKACQPHPQPLKAPLWLLEESLQPVLQHDVNATSVIVSTPA